MPKTTPGPPMRRPLLVSALTQQLRALGVSSRSVLLVHTAFSQVGPIEHGPRGLIEALLSALEPHGTLVMPSMTDDDEHGFDAGTTPCRGMGVVADTFWRMPGVMRSDSPHAFAACGPHAVSITAPHPVDVPHGLDSPVGRVYESGGSILLLGVGHDANTTIHLAENLAGVRYRRRARAALLQGRKTVRVEYGEVDHCCRRFALVDEWLDAAGAQRRGRIGAADARLMSARDVVAAVVARLREEETIFLHEPGVDAECDEARASLVHEKEADSG